MLCVSSTENESSSNKLQKCKENIFVCGKFPFETSRRSNLNKHKKTCCKDSNKIKHECQLCFKKFDRKMRLVEHMKTRHNLIQNYKCSFCEKQFSNKSNLTRHEN